MQATKSSRRSSEPPHRISSGGSHQPRRISSYRTQKENEQQSLGRNPILEKGRTSQFTQVESQLKDLQEELKRTKDQLASSESCRKTDQQEAEQAKMKLLLMCSKFEDSQRQLIELSASEDDRIHELRKISQERDKAWQSEVVALQNQQSIDMAAWSSVTKEMQKLKSKIELLKEELIEKDSVIESLKIEIARTEGANELMNKLTIGSTQTESQLKFELKEAKDEIADLKSKPLNKDTDLRSIIYMNKMLNDEIRVQVSQVEAEFSSKITQEAVDISELTIESSQRESELESELKETKAEIANLKSTLVIKDADFRTMADMNKKLNDEIREHMCHEEAEFSSNIKQAVGGLSELRSESSHSECKLESELEEAKAEIAELKSKLVNKDVDLITILDMNNKLNDDMKAQVSREEAEFSSMITQATISILGLTFESVQKESELESELKEAQTIIADLKSKLANKDIELKSILDMNKKLNNEIRAQVNQVDMNTKLNDDIKAQVSREEAEFSSVITEATIKISGLTFESIQTESEQESELKEAQAIIADLKSKLANKDSELKSILDMNKKLNNEIRAQVIQVKAELSSKITQAAIDISELKVKLTDKDAAHKQFEAELRRVKVHSKQWRKAAETAAAILMEWNNGTIIERIGSVDPEYLCDRKNLMNSPSSDEMSGESPLGKNHNVLRRIVGLWKKR